MKRTVLILGAASILFGSGVWLGAVLDQFGFLDATRDRLAIVASWDWTAIGAVITGIATVALAAFAIELSRTSSRALDASTRQAVETGRAATAAAEAAAAANRQADATAKAADAAVEATAAANRQADAAARALEQKKLEMEKAIEPRLTMELHIRSPGLTSLKLKNVGQGAALHCIAALHAFGPGHRFQHSNEFEVGRGESRQIELSQVVNDNLARVLTEDLDLDERGEAYAVGYEDALGNRRRSVLGASGTRLQADYWARGADGQPEWATWVERK